MATRSATPTLRRFRQILVGLLALLVLAFGVCEWIEWPFLHGPLERALTKGLARPVSIGGDFGLRLLGTVHLHGARLVVGPGSDDPVAPGQDGKAPDFLRAEDVRLALPYSTLWALIRGRHDRPLAIESLDVARLDVNLLRDAQGRANWHFGAPHEAQTAPQLPQFGRLVVQNGRLHVDDALSQLRLDVAVRSQEGGSAGDARLEADAKGRYRKSPLTARLETNGLLPMIDQGPQAKPVPVKLHLELGATRLDLDGSVADLLHFKALDDRFELVAPSLAAAGDSLGLTLPTTAPFRMNGRITKAGEVWRAQVAGLVLGSSRLEGDFRFDRSQPKPMLTGRLGGARLALPDLAPAFGAPRTADAHVEKRNAAARLLPQREFDIPSLAAMNADVHIALDSFHLGTPQLESLAPLAAHVVLKDGRLAIDELDARSSGGRVSGGFSLDAQQRDDPHWGADLRWSGIELSRFIKARDTRRTDPEAQALARRGQAASYISGALSGRAQLRGAGRSAAQLLGSLDGTTQMWLKDGRISHLLIEMAGIDLAESLGLVMSGDSTLPVRCALARFSAKDGVLRPDVAVLDTSDTTLVVTGSVSLADERLDLLVHARPRDMTPVAFRGPVRIEGTFAHPDVHLDRGKIGVRVAAAAALATVAAPLAGLLAFVDLGDPDKAVCSDAVARMQGPAPRTAVRSSRRAAEAETKAQDDERNVRARPPATHRSEP